MLRLGEANHACLPLDLDGLSLQGIAERLFCFCLRDEKDVLVLAIDGLELKAEDSLPTPIRAYGDTLISTFDQL